MGYYDIIISGIVFIGAFLGISILLKKGPGAKNDRFLGAALLIIALAFSYYILRSSGLLVKFPHLLRVVSPLIYLIGPLFYIYLRNSLDGIIGLKKIDLLHFLPAIFHFLELIPFYLLPLEDKRLIAGMIAEDFNNFFFRGSGIIPIQLHYGLRILQSVIYIGLIFSLVKDVFRNKKEGYAWIKVVSIAYVLFVILFAGLYFMGVAGFDPHLKQFGTLLVINIYGLTVITIFGFQIFMRPSSLRSGKYKTAKNENNSNLDMSEGIDHYQALVERYTEAGLKVIIDNLIERVSDPLVFTNSALKIADVANDLGCPARAINTLLNHRAGIRFQDLLNKNRVEYVKQLIKEGRHETHTIESLGMESGFSSRSSFFRIFKDLEGLTPKDYAEKLVFI